MIQINLCVFNQNVPDMFVPPADGQFRNNKGREGKRLMKFNLNNCFHSSENLLKLYHRRKRRKKFSFPRTSQFNGIFLRNRSGTWPRVIYQYISLFLKILSQNIILKASFINIFFYPLRLVDHVDGDAVVVPSRLLDTVRGSPRLEVEGDRVCSREGLDGADSSRSPVVLDGVTVARYLGGALPDAHIHRVPGVLEP